MCRPVRCSTCGKTTWAGCGQHVDEVKAGVAAANWCTCERNETAPSSLKSMLGGLFGR